MVRQTKVVKLVTVCPNCGEAVDILVTKKQLKILQRQIKLTSKHMSIKDEEKLYGDMRTK